MHISPHSLSFLISLYLSSCMPTTLFFFCFALFTHAYQLHLFLSLSSCMPMNFLSSSYSTFLMYIKVIFVTHGGPLCTVCVLSSRPFRQLHQAFIWHRRLQPLSSTVLVRTVSIPSRGSFFCLLPFLRHVPIGENFHFSPRRELFRLVFVAKRTTTDPLTLPESNVSNSSCSTPAPKTNDWKKRKGLL